MDTVECDYAALLQERVDALMRYERAHLVWTQVQVREKAASARALDEPNGRVRLLLADDAMLQTPAYQAATAVMLAAREALERASAALELARATLHEREVRAAEWYSQGLARSASAN